MINPNHSHQELLPTSLSFSCLEVRNACTIVPHADFQLAFHFSFDDIHYTVLMPAIDPIVTKTQVRLAAARWLMAKVEGDEED